MKQSRIFLIFFFSILQTMLAMEHQVSSTRRQQDVVVNYNYNNIMPICSYDAFKFAKQPKDVFSITMLISPVKDENSVLIGKNDGIISRISLNTQQEECLIKHHSVKHIPMFVAAQKKDSLLVISAGNCISENKIKDSECCIWYKGNVGTKKFKPLQAIAVDREGNLLATADQSQNVAVIDLNIDKELGTKWFWDANNTDRLIDIAFNPKGTLLILAKATGITLMGWDNGKLDSIKRISNIIDIKNIYFSESRIFYITRDKQVKMVSIADILEKDERDIKPVLFFEKLLHDRIVVDEENCDSAILWTKNQKAADYLRHQMLLRKKYPNKMEEFVLETPLFCMQNVFTTDEKYEYMTKKGFLKFGKHHLCEVAFRGDNVVAISSDGKLHWWKIADANKDDKKEIVSDDLGKISEIKDTIQTKDTEDNIKKRSSLRLKPRSKSDEVDKKTVWDMLVSTKKIEEKKIEEKIEEHGESKQTSPKQEYKKKSPTVIAKQENKRHSSPITHKKTPEDTMKQQSMVSSVSSPMVPRKTDISNIVEENTLQSIFSTTSSPIPVKKAITSEVNKRYSLSPKSPLITPPVSSQLVPQSKPIMPSQKSSSSPDIPRRKPENIEQRK